MSALVDAQVAFTRDVALLIGFAGAKGWGLTFGEAWRNRQVQDAYVAAGLSWTNNSRHLDRLAVDFNLVIGGKVEMSDKAAAWTELGRFWESLSDQNKWGVGTAIPRKDAGHFERRRP